MDSFFSLKNHKRLSFHYDFKNKSIHIEYDKQVKPGVTYTTLREVYDNRDSLVEEMFLKYNGMMPKMEIDTITIYGTEVAYFGEIRDFIYSIGRTIVEYEPKNGYIGYKMNESLILGDETYEYPTMDKSVLDLISKLVDDKIISKVDFGYSTTKKVEGAIGNIFKYKYDEKNSIPTAILKIETPYAKPSFNASPENASFSFHKGGDIFEAFNYISMVKDIAKQFTELGVNCYINVKVDYTRNMFTLCLI
jgi:hypothetical protein